MSVSPHGPEPCASASSAISAYSVFETLNFERELKTIIFIPALLCKDKLEERGKIKVKTTFGKMLSGKGQA